MRMDKVLKAYMKMYPKATKKEFKEYWETLNIFLKVRGVDND